MADKANGRDLSAAFRQHLAETETQVRRLETILEAHTGSVETKTCKVISGLITEAKDSMKDADDPAIMDVTLIAAAQQVEHHEMAVYGTLREWAQMMGHTRDLTLLNSTLNEEKAADEKLTNITCDRGCAASRAWVQTFVIRKALSRRPFSPLPSQSSDLPTVVLPATIEEVHASVQSLMDDLDCCLFIARGAQMMTAQAKSRDLHI